MPTTKPFDSQFWLALATLLNAIVLGFFVVLIAWRQWHTANQKLKLDLYQKRYAVYVEFAARIRLADDSPDDLRHETLHELPEARFLFGPDVQSFAVRLSFAINKIQIARQTIKAGRRFGKVNPHILRAPQDLREANAEIRALSSEIASVFRPYLEFETAGLAEKFWPRQLWNKIKAEMDTVS